MLNIVATNANALSYYDCEISEVVSMPGRDEVERWIGTWPQLQEKHQLEVDNDTATLMLQYGMQVPMKFTRLSQRRGGAATLSLTNDDGGFYIGTSALIALATLNLVENGNRASAILTYSSTVDIDNVFSATIMFQCAQTQQF